MLRIRSTRCVQWVYPRHYTVDSMLLPSSGNPFKCHEEIFSLQPMIPPKLNVLTFSPLTGGCSEGLDALRFFFKQYSDRRKICFIRSRAFTIYLKEENTKVRLLVCNGVVVGILLIYPWNALTKKSVLYLMLKEFPRIRHSCKRGEYIRCCPNVAAELGRNPV